jgi:hypothetical protein
MSPVVPRSVTVADIHHPPATIMNSRERILATIRHHGWINDTRHANRAHDASAAVAQWLLRRLRPSGRPVEAADELDAAVHGLAPQHAVVVESILVSQVGG